MFGMRESLPIDGTDVKLIVDGQPNEATEHEGDLIKWIYRISSKKSLENRLHCSRIYNGKANAWTRYIWN